jgi:hypothetical protein
MSATIRGVPQTSLQSGICFLNMNHLHVLHDLPLIHWLMLKQDLAVICLVDTRHTEATAVAKESVEQHCSRRKSYML